MEGYGPLKAHPFFESITWENLHHQTPPKLTAYLPAMSEDDEDCYGNVSQCARAEMGPAGPAWEVAPLGGARDPRWWDEWLKGEPV